MYLCPKCRSKMSGNVKKCPNCNFNLKISLVDYKKRELELLNRKNIKFRDKWTKRFKHINNLLNENNYGNLCSTVQISKDEYFLIVYNKLSEICIYNSYKKMNILDDVIKKEISMYNNNNFKNVSIKLNNLKYLFDLVGGINCTEYYMEKIYFNLLNYNDGIKILGYLIKDILKSNLQKNKIKSAINCYVKKLKSNFNKTTQNLLREYFRLTGKYYFSKKFDRIIQNKKLTIDQAFELKKRLLNNIFKSKTEFNIIEKANIHLKSISDNPNKKKKYQGSHTSAYIQKASQEYGVIGSYFRYY